MKDVLALILAGGVDLDLPVLTDVRATTSLPFGGRYRVIDFPLSNCVHSEIYQVGILAQYNPESLLAHLGIGRSWDLDRRRGGLRVLQPFQRQAGTDWYRGTADAIRQNLEEVRNSRASHVLLLSGDVVTKMDLGPVVQAHRSSGCPITLVASPVDASRMHRFGEIVPGAGGRVEAFHEKPAHGRSGLAFTGTSVFDEPFLVSLLAAHPRGTNLVLDFLVPLLERRTAPIHVHIFDGYFEDIGSIPSYYEANLDLVGLDPALDLSDPSWPIFTRSEERPPAFFGPSATLERAWVPHGCVIRGSVSRSILFGGVILDEGAVVTDSILMNDTIVERGARVTRAIVDKGVRIGEGSRVGDAAPAPASLADGPGPPHGITIVGKEASIGPGVTVGRGAILGVGVGPADVTGSVVPAGAVVSRGRG
jgi:glucose-1-phosphate adenylyltransferase